MDNTQPVQNTQNEGSVIPPTTEIKPKKHIGVVILLGFVLVALLAGAYYMLSNKTEPVTTGDQVEKDTGDVMVKELDPNDDTTSAIDADLEEIEIGELDSDFESIDSDINEL